MLLTTYGVFQRKWHEIEVYSEDGDIWDYLIMDEGHRAKKRGGKISESLKDMRCKHKLMITGTQIQNNLEVLVDSKENVDLLLFMNLIIFHIICRSFFTLVDICSPNLLGTYEAFTNKFVGPIDRGKYRNSAAVERIEASRMLQVSLCFLPFLL